MRMCSECNRDWPMAGEIPVEQLVDDEVRADQLRRLRAGQEARHSVCIASGAPEKGGAA